MKKAKEIFWTILADIIAIPVLLVLFAIVPMLAFADAKSKGQSGLYEAKEYVKDFAKEIKSQLFEA